MTDNYILAASGRPFQDWDAAEMKRQIIATELADDGFEVVSHPNGGFAVTRRETVTVDTVAIADDISASAYEVPEGPGDELARELADEDHHRSPESAPEIGGSVPPLHADTQGCKEPSFDSPEAPTESDVDTQPVHLKDYSKGFPPHFVLNVAPRAFIHLHILTLLGSVLMLFPHLLLAPLGGFSGFQDPVLGASVLGVIKLGGLVFAVGALSKFLYTFVFYRYEITDKYVEAIYGFISRDAPKTYYAHIRSANVVQAWWERLLLVGAVKLGTGATDQHEVVLKHIADPKRLEKELQRRYEPYVTGRQTRLD
jgi:hypothetical protein